jgi:hypothetical protein
MDLLFVVGGPHVDDLAALPLPTITAGTMGKTELATIWTFS